MKKYILIVLAAATVLLAGCDSNSDSSECTNDEIKADCADGKYSKCVDGKWTETACDNNASCNAENKCGECQDNAVDDTCADGKYKKCNAGKWEEVACDNNASCNEENKCGECSDGDEKADCKDGKYSKCVNGRWEETECADNSSCTKDGTCGKCQDGAVKDCENDKNNVGMVTICQDGQWSEKKVECPSESGKVSCTADKQCGECLTGDSSKCTNDAENTGSAIMCKDGKWGTKSEFCPSQFSCAMTDACYQCYFKCDSNNTCSEDCKESTCKDACKKNEACKKECDTNNGGCDSKCGACVNGNNINCTEDASKLGSADICFNGTFSKKSCKSIKGIDVSCTSKCLKAEGPDSCSEEEYDSVCGECQNQDDLICVKEHDERYSASYENFPYPYQVVKCEEGKLWLDGDKGYRACASDCSAKEGYDACLQN